jgi:hypothetical protein
MTRLRVCVLVLLCLFVAIPFIAVMVTLQGLMGSTERSYKCAVGLDQAANALFGGSEDETISSRVGRGALAGKPWAVVAEKVIDFIFGQGHCKNAIGT